VEKKELEEIDEIPLYSYRKIDETW